MAMRGISRTERRHVPRDRSGPRAARSHRIIGRRVPGHGRDRHPGSGTLTMETLREDAQWITSRSSSTESSSSSSLRWSMGESSSTPPSDAEATQRRILEAAPQVELIGIDRDPVALEESRANLAAYSDRVRYARDKFSNLSSVLERLGVASVRGVLLDLGVSSPQLDDARPRLQLPKPRPPRHANGSRWTSHGRCGRERLPGT